MKTLHFLLFSIFAVATVAQPPKQTALPAADWQADLRFLQNTVHTDYPFLFKKITVKDWDAKVEELYAAIPGMQEHEIVAGLERVVASFQYGHTSLGWWQSP